MVLLRNECNTIAAAQGSALGCRRGGGQERDLLAFDSHEHVIGFRLRIGALRKSYSETHESSVGLRAIPLLDGEQLKPLGSALSSHTSW